MRLHDGRLDGDLGLALDNRRLLQLDPPQSQPSGPSLLEWVVLILVARLTGELNLPMSEQKEDTMVKKKKAKKAKK